MEGMSEVIKVTDLANFSCAALTWTSGISPFYAVSEHQGRLSVNTVTQLCSISRQSFIHGQRNEKLFAVNIKSFISVFQRCHEAEGRA